MSDHSIGGAIKAHISVTSRSKATSEVDDSSFRGTEYWQRRHPDHGPCDAMGPDGTCAGCTGIFLRNDGAWFENDVMIKRPPLMVRLKAAWNAAVEAFNA